MKINSFFDINQSSTGILIQIVTHIYVFLHTHILAGRWIHQAVSGVIKGRISQKTVLSPSDVESSPETGRRRHIFIPGIGGGDDEGDVNVLGASFDEIVGYVRLKDVSASITANKVRCQCFVVQDLSHDSKHVIEQQSNSAMLRS